MAADDEEDYMSDAFIVESKLATPGLSWSKHTNKHKKDVKHKAINEKHRAKFKPLKQREEEHRIKGLGIALSSDNKGFALLQKMGYKQGMGLGKKESGRSDPISVEVKTGRGGLGRETQLKSLQDTRQRQYRELLQHRAAREVESRQDFRLRMRSKFSDRETEKDLQKSQTACQQLDQQLAINEPITEWYWPKVPSLEEEEDDDDDVDDDDDLDEKPEPENHLTASEKLTMITSYLRRQHRYCTWCGTSFTDDQDLADNCPGNTAEKHS